MNCIRRQKAMDINIARMAEDGDKYACTCLGEMYYYGNGVDQNYSRAMKWYRKAEEKGHFSAQFKVGVMYQLGDIS